MLTVSSAPHSCTHVQNRGAWRVRRFTDSTANNIGKSEAALHSCRLGYMEAPSRSLAETRRNAELGCRRSQRVAGTRTHTHPAMG